VARFLHVEAASGAVLLAATAAALAAANSPWAESFHHFWATPVGFEAGGFRLRMSLEHWINDGLMAVFFFVVGLEVKRELVLGELREPRKAALPIVAALGGMIVPAGIYLSLQHGQPGERGWGIPMATDIAFVVGCMALLGSRVPRGLRVAILSLAIVDDIGAILVIAIGYSGELHAAWLAWAAAGLVLARVAAWLGVRSLLVYAAIGGFVWFAVHESGVHATIAGVALGLMTPARNYASTAHVAEWVDRVRGAIDGEEPATAAERAEKVRRLQWIVRESISPLEYLEGTLHPWVAFAIMPIFALANAGVAFRATDLGEPVAVAVMAGLLLGKPVGIVAFSWLAVRARVAQLPEGVSWSTMLAGGMLAGIGFTMALFIASLALDEALLPVGKIGVLAGSTASAVLGMGLMLLVARRA
jgi:NhaA family Na+:H+ antiporter